MKSKSLSIDSDGSQDIENCEVLVAIKSHTLQRTADRSKDIIMHYKDTDKKYFGGSKEKKILKDVNQCSADSSDVSSDYVYRSFEKNPKSKVNCFAKPYSSDSEGWQIRKTHNHYKKKRSESVQIRRGEVNMASDMKNMMNELTNASHGDSHKCVGPTIVVDSTSSESEEFSEPSISERKNLLYVFGENSSNNTSEGVTDFTSEGGESETDVRLTSQNVLNDLLDFLDEVFSEENLSKDLFILKHVRRHPRGFVSLKLLATYKKAKKISKDWRTLAAAARLSLKFEVDSDGKKVRSVTPLPDSLKSVPYSKVIGAVNINDQIASMEALASLFGVYGAVTSLHLFRPKAGCGIPTILQSLANKIPDVYHTTCAVVEFEDVWSADRALKNFHHSDTTLHVLNHKHKSRRSAQSSASGSSPSTVSPASKREPQRKHICSNDLRNRLNTECEKTTKMKRDSTGSEADNWRENTLVKKRTTKRSSRNSTNKQIHLKEKSLSNTVYCPTVPILQRKKMGENVYRNPKGPDGTVGFKRETLQSY